MMVASPRSRLQTVALLLFVIIGAATAQGSFTIEQVMSSPFPTELVASPAGNRVAWVFDAQGMRNIWVAEPGAGGAYRSHQVTQYTQDDGQDVGELAWASDGRAIVYVRGGDLENGGNYPNPGSLAEGVEQDVWVVSIEGGAPRKLAEGHSPAVSSKGDGVAYIFKDQVWLVKLAAGAKPEQLIRDKGKCDSLDWSSDGSSLAFVSRRGDHSFVGVYEVGSKSLVYLDPTVDHDSDPAWSPDSRQVAFLRIPARADLTFGARRTGQPWSIWVADAATGHGHEVWLAETGQGSVFHGIVGEHQIIWGAEDVLVFPWERDGWTHLYSVPAAGGTARLLTPGDFEVEFVSLSPDRHTLIFARTRTTLTAASYGPRGSRAVSPRD